MDERENSYTDEINLEERRQRRIKRRQARKKQIIKKFIMLIACIAAAIMIIVGIISLVSVIKTQKKDTVTEDGTVLVQTDISQLKHISFGVLSVNGQDGTMSVDDFEKTLDELYSDGYCLVDLYDIADKDEQGNFVYKDTIMFPENKKPLIISQRDVCYGFDASQKDTASRMVMDSETVKCEYTDKSGKTRTGNYDVVPIVESFIKKHSDFSYNGARGIIGLSGYCGVLGYRTSSYLAQQENNPYAQEYGTFDTASEITKAKEVVDGLKKIGWHYACCGFASDISYGSEYSIVEQDVQNWKNEVASVVGDTDILMLPKQTDIGSWEGYKEDNKKFNYLKEMGFSYYFVGEQTTPYMLQVKPGYVRQTVFEVSKMGELVL